MVYTGFVDGYKPEATYGTSSITAQGDSTYLWGAIGQESVHPNPTVDIIYRATGVNAQEVEAGAVWKGKETLMGSYNLVLLNAVPIWAVMGGHSDAEAGGVYTHTITPAGTTSGVIDLLPSFTIQHELAGTSTNYQVQFMGCKVSTLSLICNWDSKILMGVMDWFAQKAEKGTVGALTNAPTLPPTSNTDPYHFNNMTRTWDYGSGDVALDGLKEFEFTINPDLTGYYTHRWDGSNNYIGRYPNEPLEGSRKLYQLRLVYHQESSSVWEDLISSSNTKEMYFKWTRSANDYIELNLTDCQVLKHDIKTPEIGEPLLEEVLIEPRAVSFTVKDAINGFPYYGDAS